MIGFEGVLFERSSGYPVLQRSYRFGSLPPIIGFTASLTGVATSKEASHTGR